MYFSTMKVLRYLRYASLCNKINFSTNVSFTVENLKKRTLLKLSGKDTNIYLQSMMTNDIQNFEKLPSLYSVLLNPKGRVLYDILLYKISDNEYLVEYDSTAVNYLERHLIMYRLRRDVRIQIHTPLTPWVIYSENHDQNYNSSLLINQLREIDGIFKVVEDPRNKKLGFRVLTDKSVHLPHILPPNFQYKEDESYRLLRYKIGIGEGVLDHPPGNCLPFETNIDILNGVSFTKGCYIGQELTAKSQHVFVIRKRLMPIVLQKMDSYPLFPPECVIINENLQKLGRLRSHLGQHGLGLLKYEDCAKSKLLKLKDFDVTLETAKPNWWPSNLSSENV